MPNSNYLTALASTTFAKHLPDMIDNISDSNLLFKTLMPKRKPWTGGTKIDNGAHYALNNTAGFYAGADILDSTPQNNQTRAEFDIKQAAVSVSITGIDKAKNRGDEAIVSLLETEKDNAEMALFDLFNRSFYSDGSASGGKEFDGFSAMISTTDPAVGAYGNIARATNTWWQATVNSVGGAMTLDMLRTQFSNQSRSNDQPDLIVTTSTLRNKYESLLTPSLRLASRERGNVSFNTLAFGSNDAQVMWDEHCQSGVVYFINTKYVDFYVDPSNFMRMTPFSEPGQDNQDVMKAFMLTYGNLVCWRSEAQGKITSVTV